MLVIWARHGQNQANLTRQFSHRRLDLDLTVVGREQAEALAGLLARRLDHTTATSPALFASPLRRAQQTAEIVARRLDGDVETIDALREVDIGELDGRRDPAAWATYTSVLDAWGRGEHGRRFPGGEDLHDLCTRLATALERVARAASGRPAVVVAHGANLRGALPGLTGLPDPGKDLGTGQFAELEVLVGEGAAPRIRLLAWRSSSSS